MLKGQILYYTKNTNCARIGALAVYEGDRGRYIDVRWLRNHLSCTQMDGGYHLDDFRLATPGEIDAHELSLTQAVEAFVAAKAAVPRFTVGDYVYVVRNQCHDLQPLQGLGNLQRRRFLLPWPEPGRTHHPQGRGTGTASSVPDYQLSEVLNPCSTF